MQHAAILLLLAVAPGVRAQLGNAPMPAQDIDALRAVHAREISDLSTFKTAGLQREAIDSYLDSGPGQQFLRELRGEM